jgi:hypothetical protein
MKKTTVLMATVLAIATVLTAGLTVLPGSVQEAQANPCSNNIQEENEGATGGGGSTVTAGGDQECTLIGNFEGAFDEDESSDSGLAATETDGAEATETDGAEATTGNNIIDDPLFDLSDAFDESD